MQPAFTPEQLKQLSTVSIIDVLGMTELEDTEKEILLNEFQDTLWEDIFTEYVADSLTDKEVEEYEQVLIDDSTTEQEKRDIIFDWLIDKVPNLPEVIQEKTSLLKAELLDARIQGLSEYYQTDATKKDTVMRAADKYQMADFSNAMQMLSALA